MRHSIKNEVYATNKNPDYSNIEFFIDEIASKHVRSDMWLAYLKVINQRYLHANHVLDRFHIVQNLNKSIKARETEEIKKEAVEGKNMF